MPNSGDRRHTSLAVSHRQSAEGRFGGVLFQGPHMVRRYCIKVGGTYLGRSTGLTPKRAEGGPVTSHLLVPKGLSAARAEPQHANARSQQVWLEPLRRRSHAWSCLSHGRRCEQTPPTSSLN